jgi:hypothetical protein
LQIAEDLTVELIPDTLWFLSAGKKGIIGKGTQEGLPGWIYQQNAEVKACCKKLTKTAHQPGTPALKMLFYTQDPHCKSINI